LLPFGQRILPVLLESVSIFDVAMELEVVVARRMNGGEFLKTSHSPETKHGPLMSSRSEIGTLCYFANYQNLQHTGFTRKFRSISRLMGRECHCVTPFKLLK
jgi:hypothetical protein